MEELAIQIPFPPGYATTFAPLAKYATSDLPIRRMATLFEPVHRHTPELAGCAIELDPSEKFWTSAFPNL
jgi:hypothetical protein